MRVDDDIYLFGFDSGGCKGGRQQFLIPVNFPHLCVLLIADPCLDDNSVAARSDHNGVESKHDTIQLVGRGSFLPERFGHNPEHCATVKTVGAVCADD
jgi:hypothetical protein